MKIDGGLRSLFRQHLPQIMFTTIESASTEQGIPDLFYCCDNGQSGWCEMKKTNGNKIVFQSGQTAWHERYARMGGQSFIVVRFNDQLLLYAGSKARKLQLGGRVAAIPLLRCDGGPKNWNWKKVAAALGKGMK